MCRHGMLGVASVRQWQLGRSWMAVGSRDKILGRGMECALGNLENRILTYRGFAVMIVIGDL